MKKILTPSLVLLMAAGNSFAAVLVSWNFNTNLTPTISTNATSSVLSAANATISGGVSGGWQNNANAANVGPASANGTWSTTNSTTLGFHGDYALGTADAVNGGLGFVNTSNYTTTPDTGKYVGFQLTMNSSIDPSLNQLEGIQFNLSNAGTSGPRGVEVTYRIGTSGSFTSIGGTATPTLTANRYGLFTFNLPSPITLSGGDVVEFRLLGYANGTGNSIRLDNVSITAIPEPAATAFLAAAGLFFVLQRVRRRMGPLRR